MSVAIALAGRRIDAADAGTTRFPLGSVGLVRSRLHDLFTRRRARALVCSAACGADLVALEVAAGLGMRRRIVLPFAPDRFRATSVTDRPGDWGPSYDRSVEAVATADDLVVEQNAGEGDVAYADANRRIVEEAARLAAELAGDALAVVVWEGGSRGPDDATQQFADLARAAGLEVEEVLTR